jgi:serine/threonine-protein kinase
MVDPQPEQDAFEVLDAYLERVHAGDKPDRDALLREHPELASALRCLDALDSLAPGPKSDTGEQAATVELTVDEIGPPRRFGSYELLEEIGRGGMGVVYKARQESLDRSVAIKMILSSHLASAEHVRRFQAEAKAAAGLRHPHIVHIHEVGQLHGQHYFAMEYVEGMSLAERMARRPVEVEKAATLISKVARAVAYLHQHAIVHRDLKPSNILLDDEEEPCVTDFGLAKVFAAGSEMTATGVIAGTPSYMAPEQAAGRQDRVGPACDIYSLGAILYELLTGRPPFRADTPLDTVMEVLSREPALPRRVNRHVPRELELICLRCLAKSPDARYSTAAAMADDLDHFLKGEALDARPPHVGQRILRWARREPALASRLAALGVFFVVEWVNFARELNNPQFRQFHWKVCILIAVWAATAVVFQQAMKSPRWAFPARYVWGALDSVLLLAVLLLADGAASPLVVGYPLLIVGSGLWFRVRFVWFITALSLLSYAILVVDFYSWRTHLQQSFDTNPDRHIIFAVAIVAIAGGVSYLVHRVRTLSTFYGQKP